MIRSMTGFARREVAGAFGTLAWELRTVNHRYLEVSLRLPEDLRALESEFRTAVGAAVRRGKVDAGLYLRSTQAAGGSLEVNVAALDQLTAAASAASARVVPHLGALAPPSALDLLRWPGVLKEPERDATPLQEAARTLLAEALGVLGESRAAEGARS
ncbi:MAG: YicC/YloC family endoribonuclease, partial [Pseudomonadota bacterium]